VGYGGPAVLRLLLAVVLGWALWRLVRGVLALVPRPPEHRSPPGERGSRRLDPSREVRTTWSEVEQEEERRD
jgi:hypothetical protein